jgi:hypothetical protein
MSLVWVKEIVWAKEDEFGNLNLKSLRGKEGKWKLKTWTICKLV